MKFKNSISSDLMVVFLVDSKKRVYFFIFRSFIRVHKIFIKREYKILWWISYKVNYSILVNLKRLKLLLFRGPRKCVEESPKSHRTDHRPDTVLLNKISNNTMITIYLLTFCIYG